MSDQPIHLSSHRPHTREGGYHPDGREEKRTCLFQLFDSRTNWDDDERKERAEMGLVNGQDGFV